MAASQFYFLQNEFPEVYQHARRAEELALSDARSACVHARLALETAVKWMYRSDRVLRSPYETTLSALIHEPTFRNLVGDDLVTKAKLVKDIGNMAAHETKAIPQPRAITALRELFHFSYWLVRTYAKGQKPDSSITFSADKDGFLVPPKAISVPIKIPNLGINYDDLSPEEKERWDAIEWDEDGNIPDFIEPADVNTWLFNKDTVDKILKHLMKNGLYVEDGDRLGKTIIFAKNHDHAEFIADRFNENYPHYKGKFARVIDFRTEYAQSLIDDFSEPEKLPQIAISVDMLDTGIDVPDVVNLVFFKIVRSKTKFWQMIGRGTRLRPDLFGPGMHKSCFYIFDFCRNFEFFNQNPELSDSASGESLSQRLFKRRVELLGAIDDMSNKSDREQLSSLREEVCKQLQDEVLGMNFENFVVRPKRRTVEKYQDSKIWEKLNSDKRLELIEELSDLPTSLIDTDTAAKQFDLLLLNAELSLLNFEKSFLGYKKKIIQTASALATLQNVPMVAKEMDLIIDIQNDDFWANATPNILDMIRKRLRSLVKLIEFRKRPHVFTNFEDEIGEQAEVDLPKVNIGTDMQRFKAKAQHFLKEHIDHITIQKVRLNEALTTQDIAELERLFIESGVATPEDLVRLKKEVALGLFIGERIWCAIPMPLIAICKNLWQIKPSRRLEMAFTTILKELHLVTFRPMMKSSFVRFSRMITFM